MVQYIVNLDIDHLIRTWIVLRIYSILLKFIRLLDTGMIQCIRHYAVRGARYKNIPIYMNVCTQGTLRRNALDKVFRMLQNAD